MTVEELIKTLQKIENKKRCVKVAINAYGYLKYERIRSIRLAVKEKEEIIKQQNLIHFTDNGYVVIEGGGIGE